MIAACDSSPVDRAGADVVCTGKDDVAVLAKAFSVPDREVLLTAGAFDGNAGFTSAGNRYLRPAEGVTVRGAGPGLTRLNAAREACRIAVDAPGVTLVFGTGSVVVTGVRSLEGAQAVAAEVQAMVTSAGALLSR